MFHKNALVGDIHIVNNWTVADPTALAALTPVAGDVGKIALQVAPFALFVLQKEVGPTWVSLTALTTSLAAGSVTISDSGGYFTGADVEAALQKLGADIAILNTRSTQCIPIACSDEATALTTGTAKVTFRMPYGFTLTAVRASVTTAPTGSVLTVDINENGFSILSTKLTIDATEKTSTTAAAAAVISDAALGDDSEITIDIDTVGSTIAGAGLKVYLIGVRT